ncbi:uncharacterized protein LOC144004606 [Festucalex cinctus]
MADLITRCSSSDVENPEVNEMTENIPPGVTTPLKRQYLFEEYFPDITLLDSTCSLDKHQTMDELSLLKNMPTTPLTTSTLVRTPDWMREIMKNNSELSSIRTPMVKGKGSQPCNLDADASIVSLRNECLPDITDCSPDSIMQRSINFTINITPSDMELLNSAQKPTIEHNLERVATSTPDESTSQTFEPTPLTTSQRSFLQTKEQVMPSSNEGPTLASGPTGQDGLPSGNTAGCKTTVTSDSSTITRSTESSLNDGHHNTFEANARSLSNGTMSESNSIGSQHNTFDVKPPSQASGTLPLSDSSCSGRHHNTFDANPPSQSNSTLSVSEHGSNDSHHNALDIKLPCQSNGQTKTSSDSHHDTFDAKVSSQSSGKSTQSRLGNRHHNTFDGNPPSPCNNTLSVSENCSNDIHHNTFDVKPPSQASGTLPLSDSSCSGRHHNTFDANPPSQSNCTLSMPELGSNDSHHNALDIKLPFQSNGQTKTSSDSHHNTFDAKPPSQANGKLTLSDSSCSASHHDTFDAKVSSQSSGKSTQSRLGNRHHNTFDGNPPSPCNNTLSVSENCSNDIRHNTFDVQPPPKSNGKTSESSSSDRHHNTFDANPPSQSNCTLSMPELGSNDSHHTALATKPPCQSNGKTKTSESSSNTFDANLLSQSKMTLLMPEGGSNDSLHGTLDAKPQSSSKITLPEITSNDGHCNTFDTNPPLKNSGTTAMSESHSSDSTFDAKPQSSIKITIPESQSRVCHQTNFAATPKPNRTMSMSKSLSNDARHSTFDAKANGTKNMPGSCRSDSHPNTLNSKPPSHPGGTDTNPDADACETNLGEASASAASHCEAKDHSQSLRHDPFLYLDDNSKTFSLDDPLELKHGNFATSTPLTSNFKMDLLSGRTDESKLLALQQNHVDTTSKPEAQATSNVASNICDPKILFQSQLPAKSLLPSSKASSLPLMVKQSTLLPGRSLPLMKRTLIPHATTIASRPNTHQPKPGVEKPQHGGKLSSIPRGPPLLKPLLRSSTLASADKKPSNAAVNIPQTRKRDFSRDAQLAVKKTKIDVPTSSTNIVTLGPSMHATSAMRSSRQVPPRHKPPPKNAKDDAAVSPVACDADTRPKILKPPMKSQRPQLAKASGCVKCIILEQQLQMQTEELQRLKEEQQSSKKEKDK